MYEHTAGRDLKSSFEWLEFAAGLPSRIIPWTAQAASFQGVKGRFVLQGLVAVNNNAAAQTITLHDGEDASGAMFYPASVGIGANLYQPFSPRGVLCETGVFVQLSAGPWNVTLLGVPLWHYSTSPPGE